MPVFQNIISDSENVSYEELKWARRDKKARLKMYRNLFHDFYMLLEDLQETDSQESQERDKFKRQKPTAKDPALTATSPPAPRTSFHPTDIESPPSSDSAVPKISRPSTPPCDQPCYPADIETPTNKRNFSDTSFRSQSTETTLKKLSQLEAKVQSLQNTFVTTMINKLWLGSIDMPWVKGRYMFMTYSPYFRCSS
jgi:hypothetical protein